MIVTCPQCAKRYMLDDELLPKKGRQVRCIACSHVWLQVPEISPHQKKLSFPEPLHVSSVKKKRFGWLKWSASLILILILALGGAVVFERNTVVDRFPQAEKVYALLGLPLSSQRAGLAVTNAKILYDQTDSQDMMVVSGDLTNSSNQVKPIPPLKLKLVGEESHPKCRQTSDKKTCVVDEWDHHLSESFLLPGETIHFETHPRSKVEGIRNVSVEF